MKVNNAVHPVTEVRERMGLTRLEFARRMGLPYSSLANTEAGYPSQLPHAVLAVLIELGQNANKSEQRYQEWRKAHV